MTVRTEPAKVLEAVVVVAAVGVIELEGQRAPLPLTGVVAERTTDGSKAVSRMTTQRLTEDGAALAEYLVAREIVSDVSQSQPAQAGLIGEMRRIERQPSGVTLDGRVITSGGAHAEVTDHIRVATALHYGVCKLLVRPASLLSSHDCPARIRT